ncbi:SIMPL domain-containing protein, partial [Candidatus Woesearchaeota archaeon]|nr:SIMPL domain-containing protein [Candidatus Woesearchaeota archaeon]
EAVLYIRVMTEKPTSRTAQDANSQLMNTVKAALENDGVEKSDMETTNYNMYRKQDWNPTTQKYDYGDYVVQHTLKVTTTDITGVGDLLDTAVNAGANGLDNVQFQLSDAKQEQVNDQALKAAAGKAKEKAESIADSIGVKLGDIVTVSESNVGYTPYYYPRYAMAEASYDSKGSGAPEISPQSVQVSATVSIVYEIK